MSLRSWRTPQYDVFTTCRCHWRDCHQPTWSSIDWPHCTTNASAYSVSVLDTRNCPVQADHMSVSRRLIGRFKLFYRIFILDHLPFVHQLAVLRCAPRRTSGVGIQSIITTYSYHSRPQTIRLMECNLGVCHPHQKKSFISFDPLICKPVPSIPPRL
jgi:hypothetical protein